MPKSAWPISALTVLVLAVTLLTVQATPWQPTIRGCAAEITSNGDVFKLVGTDTFSQFIQCECVHSNSLRFHFELNSVQPIIAICMITAMEAHPGHTVSMYASLAVFLLLFLLISSLLQDFHNYTLYHYPNTPIPVDSNPNCPTVCPLAGTYLIKTAAELPGQCVTMTSNADGAPVQIKVSSRYYYFYPSPSVLSFPSLMIRLVTTATETPVRNGPSMAPSCSRATNASTLKTALTPTVCGYRLGRV